MSSRKRRSSNKRRLDLGGDDVPAKSRTANNNNNNNNRHTAMNVTRTNNNITKFMCKDYVLFYWFVVFEMIHMINFICCGIYSIILLIIHMNMDAKNSLNCRVKVSNVLNIQCKNLCIIITKMWYGFNNSNNNNNDNIYKYKCSFSNFDQLIKINFICCHGYLNILLVCHNMDAYDTYCYNNKINVLNVLNVFNSKYIIVIIIITMYNNTNIHNSIANLIMFTRIRDRYFILIFLATVYLNSIQLV